MQRIYKLYILTCFVFGCVCWVTLTQTQTICLHKLISLHSSINLHSRGVGGITIFCSIGLLFHTLVLGGEAMRVEGGRKESGYWDSQAPKIMHIWWHGLHILGRELSGKCQPLKISSRMIEKFVRDRISRWRKFLPARRRIFGEYFIFIIFKFDFHFRLPKYFEIHCWT